MNANFIFLSQIPVFLLAQFAHGLGNHQAERRVFVWEIRMKLIPLHGKDGEGKFAQVDDTDFDELNKYHWYVNNSGYAFRREKVIFMHRQIIKADDKQIEVVDHVNRNPLDNQKKNLRPATKSQNATNKRMPGTNKTGFLGVHFDKGSGRYRSQIKHNGKRINIGRFDNPEDAFRSYDAKAREVWGEFYKGEQDETRITTSD